MDNRIKIPRLLRLLILWVLVAALCMGISYAWVSMNKTVNDSGFGFGLSPDLMDNFSNAGRFMIVEEGQTDGEELVSRPGNNFLPGDSSDFYIGMYNKSSISVSLSSFGIDIPKIWTTESGTYNPKVDVTDEDAYDEVPILKDGKYYYFGKEIKIQITSFTVYTATLNESTGTIGLESEGSVRFIPGTDDECFKPLQFLLNDNFSLTQRIQLLDFTHLNANGMEGELIIAPTQAAVFSVHIEFINRDNVDQSVFMGFGPSGVGGRCHRNVYAVFKQDV